MGGAIGVERKWMSLRLMNVSMIIMLHSALTEFKIRKLIFLYGTFRFERFQTTPIVINLTPHPGVI